MSKKKKTAGSVKLKCPQCEATELFKPYKLKECRFCGYTYTKDEILKGEQTR